MKNSLCAHCAHTDEVAYCGFLCNETGYCENKTVAEGCQAFEPDSIDELTRMITEELLAAYQSSAEFTVVKHGYLGKYDDCSVCGAWVNGRYENYCANCGAKLDLPVPDEE